MSVCEQDRTTICLFDIDGTLTMPRLRIEAPMMKTLHALREKIPLAIVGGSDEKKAREQLGEETFALFEYRFFENGLVAYKGDNLIHQASLKGHLGDTKLRCFIDYCLIYIAKLDIPVKRGTFIEFRSGMLNVSPIGRNCSQEERIAFNELDEKMGYRKAFVKDLQEKFADYGLSFSIGGQISFDVFPIGWDKTYCLQHLDDAFTSVHFFGDKTHPGGNDHEIYESSKTIGHKVNGPDDTQNQLRDLFSF
mmetsp:Transcript_29874/g.83482  ORF Transcript_29874/g.83482 Transcript_29874/m.83482 type:complete len:250 (+) Transcript_29874:24-773(+)